MSKNSRIDLPALLFGIEQIGAYQCNGRTLTDGRKCWEVGFHVTRQNLARGAAEVISSDIDLDAKLRFLHEASRPVPAKIDMSEECEGTDMARAHVSILARAALQRAGIYDYPAITPADVEWVLETERNFCLQEGRFKKDA